MTTTNDVLVAILTAVAIGGWFGARPAVLAAAGRRSGDLKLHISAQRSLAVLRRLDTVVFDATGTITDGELQVVAVEALDPAHDRNLRWFAGALQHSADDPVARAISRLSAQGRVTDVEQVPGAGISGSVDRHPVRVGRPEWIGLEADHTGSGYGRTLGVEVDGRALGRITVADMVRPQAADAVAALHTDGWQVVMTTPAAESEAQQIAEQTGPDQVLANADEDARVRLVQELRSQGRVVAVVGRSADNVGFHAAGDVAVTDEGATAPVTLTMTDVAIHHVVRLLRLVRGLPGVVRAVRAAPLIVCMLAVPAVLLTSLGVPITAGAVIVSGIAASMPILRWRAVDG